MTDFSDTTAIATPEQYRAALLAVRDRMSDAHLAMLQAHCRAPDHTITATRLAEAAGLATYSAANLRYGTFAHWLADALGYAPDPRPSGAVRWWPALAYGKAGPEGALDGHFEWVMRPELVATLQSMRWA